MTKPRKLAPVAHILDLTTHQLKQALADGNGNKVWKLLDEGRQLNIASNCCPYTKTCTIFKTEGKDATPWHPVSQKQKQRVKASLL